MREVLALVVTVVSAFAADTKLPPSLNRPVDFEKEVQPLLAAKCFSCHGEEVQQSGLRLDRRQLALRGGDYGPVIVIGKSAESKLIKRVANGDGGLQMPPTGPLTDEEIGLLRAWIDQGADYRIQVQDEPAPKPLDPRLASLISAVRSRNAKAAMQIVAGSPELVKAADGAGSTALHHAAGFGDVATMKMLIERGADTNAANRRKSTPLFWALHDEAKVRLLLEHGANVNAKTVDGRTPVFQAATMANAAGVLRILLDKGGDPNARTMIGVTPLISAAGSNVEALRVLIEHKADVNGRTAAGGTALMMAARMNRADAVHVLLEHGADANARTKKNETALQEAATAGNEEIVRMLLERKVDVNVQDIRGYSALAYAAGSDAMSPAVVKLLLAAGADPGLKGDDETAAMLAGKRGDTQLARLLNASFERNGGAPVKTRVRTIAEAVGPALALLEKQSHTFIRVGGCNSCHAQDLPSAAVGIAKSHGLPAPKEIPVLPRSQTPLNPSRWMDLVVVSPSDPAWQLFNAGMNGRPRDEYTDAAIRYIKNMQSASGEWQMPAPRRPPMVSSAIQVTALQVYALRHYAPPAEKVDTEVAVSRAVAWLQTARPQDLQDRAMRLLGLVWGGANQSAIAGAVKDVTAQQREDGGWSQFPTMETDAYATGEALYALATSGMATRDPAYANGVKYLLRTQAEDGSWHVRSRSIWLQPYFESGFPYGHDQWISGAGTAWATMALSMAAGSETKIARR
jgi:ankyrin repeat protein